MLSRVKRAFYHWHQAWLFKKLPRNQKRIVFYAGDSAAWEHLRPVIVRLIHRYKHDVAYLTAVDNDKVLSLDVQGIHAFAVGRGVARWFAFWRIRPYTVITTSCELFRFYQKPEDDTRCVYVHNAITSLHANDEDKMYHKFDTFFCAGPHHAKEVRQMENAQMLGRKTLIKFGHARLDSIIHEYEIGGKKAERIQSERRHILIAPSAGKNAMSATVADSIIGQLLKLGYQVTLRAPYQNKKHAIAMKAIAEKYAHEKEFKLETILHLSDNFYRADLMISDCSGLALEFAFGLECPVLYINMPIYRDDDDYDMSDVLSIEYNIRSDIGEVLAQSDLDQLPEMVEHMLSNRYQYIKSIINKRDQVVYNLRNSGAYGAKYIDNVMKEFAV